ncbi:MAG: OmpA family protein [Saprospiraceae bacterium]|nr:OmpA family protein [Saprospiraceae bacterium]
MNENRNWWFWLIGTVVLIGFLWTQVQSCRDREWTDRTKNAMRGFTAAVDSSAIKAEMAIKAAYAKFDSAGLYFKARWDRLGKMINIRLDTFNLSLPEQGVELKLLEWLQSKSSIIDKNTWFNFDRILFQSGSATLNNISDEQIENIARIMKAMPKVEFKIGGYTDNVGDPQGNLELSKARADAVMQALIARGIDAARLSSEGYGQEHPVADNSSEAGRELNRRVAIRVERK